MGATGWFVGLCAALSLQGCVTPALWEGWGEDERFTQPPAVPQKLLEAVRAGDGSHHLRVLMSLQNELTHVIDGPGHPPDGDAAAIGSHAWPGTTTSTLPVPRPDFYGRFPPGVPVAVATPRPPQPWNMPPTPDTAMAVLIDAPTDDANDDPVMSLEGRRVVLTHADGQVDVLAEFRPPQPLPPPPPPRSSFRRVASATVRLVISPFALAADALIVISIGLVSPLVFFFT